MGLSYSLAVAVFGGTAPLIMEALDLVVTQDHNPDLDVKTIIKDAEEKGTRKTPEMLLNEARNELGADQPNSKKQA